MGVAIRYTTSIVGVTPEQLEGFFVGWPNPPSSGCLRTILTNSSHFVLALDGSRVVGFVNALSDGVLYAFVPLLEVLPDYQKQGIGRHLVRHLLQEIGDIYAVDLLCDENVRPFYGKLGFAPGTAMLKRNYKAQCGKT